MKNILAYTLILLLMAVVCSANPFSGGGGAKSAEKSETIQKNDMNSFYVYLNKKQKVFKDKIAVVFKDVKENPFSGDFFAVFFITQLCVWSFFTH